METNEDKLIRHIKRTLSANEVFELALKERYLIRTVKNIRTQNEDWWKVKESYLLSHHWTLEEYLLEMGKYVRDEFDKEEKLTTAQIQQRNQMATIAAVVASCGLWF